MITAGIDCGAKNTQAIVMRKGRIIGKAMLATGYEQEQAAEEALAQAAKDAGIARGDIQRIFATGSGCESLKVAEDTVNEIKAMARGAHFFFPSARTVIDIGAEEGRAVKIDQQGNVVDFAIGEKCAAGAGAFIEGMARALDVSVEEMGSLCLQSDQDIPMNAQCVIFAESDVVNLIHANTQKPEISKAVHDAVASRVASIIRRIGINEDIVMLGGLGCNPGFIAALRRELKIDTIYTPDEPEYGAAVGAAILAAESAKI
ncbi:MAG: acyl-CoA dehydratase activase [Desulfobacterales bacterium]|jgi:benzoyl-CoA reductase subunit D